MPEYLVKLRDGRAYRVTAESPTDAKRQVRQRQSIKYGNADLLPASSQVKSAKRIAVPGRPYD